MRNLGCDTYWRSHVMGVNAKVPAAGGYVTAVNFDNAATTPPLCSVMDAVVAFAPWYSSIHRGAGYKSVMSSGLYDEARETVKQFVRAGQDDVVVFTKNTTESINLLAHVLAQSGEKRIILTSDMEHLANDLPWRSRFDVEYCGIDSDGRLLLEDFQRKLETNAARIALVAVTAASNVTGYVNPVHDLARMAHRHGVKIFVDGAQLVPHAPCLMNTRISEERIDFLAFSAHKLYAPFGVGVLLGPQADLAASSPLLQGGGAVDLTSQQFVEWDTPPERFEAGTPNVMGVVALTAAIKTLQGIGLDAIHDYERRLIAFALEELSNIPGITIYSSRGCREERVSLVSFTLDGMDHAALAQALSHEAGIAVRSGLFCAHPYVEKLLGLTEDDLHYYHTHADADVPGLVRISFGLYNTLAEIERFNKFLRHIAANSRYYNGKYGKAQRMRCGNPRNHDFC